MNLQVDLKTQHYMQAHLFEDQYIIMIWPKETSLRRLQHAREIVDFQLDTFIESAKRDEPRKEYARLEVERSEEHTSELQSLIRISYAVFCLNKQKKIQKLLN